jgi:hypothetical protein
VRSERDARAAVARWTLQLQAAHLTPQLHVVDVDTVLIYLVDDTSLDDVLAFLLQQPEVEYHESNGQKRYSAAARAAQRREARAAAAAASAGGKSRGSTRGGNSGSGAAQTARDEL